MFRITLIAALLLSTSYAVADEVEENFKKAAAASGPEYVKLRDGLVQSAPDSFLKEKAKSGTFEEKIVSVSVLGWKANGKLYAEKMSAPTNTSKAGNVYFDWATGRKGMDGPLTPLGLELMFKNTAGTVGQGSGQRALSVAARRPSFEHGDLLFAYVTRVPVADVEVAKLTAQVIAGMPPTLAPQEKIIETLHQLAKDEKNGRQVNAVLATTLVRSAARLQPAEKEKLIDSLVSEEGLLKSLGPETALRIAGGTGSPKAALAIEKFLRGSREPQNHGWAFLLLRNTRDGSGTEILQNYAGDNSLPEGGRLLALNSLVAVKYLPSVGETAKKILDDTGAPMRVRVEAIRTLDQLIRVHQNNNEIAAPLREIVLATDFGTTQGTTEHKPFVDAVKKGVRENAP
ncbi:MAG: hypothetical protein AB7O26_13065 [Planctomycetaceae bacterium]